MMIDAQQDSILPEQTPLVIDLSQAEEYVRLTMHSSRPTTMNNARSGLKCVIDILIMIVSDLPWGTES